MQDEDRRGDALDARRGLEQAVILVGSKVNGFLYVSTRNVLLKPSALSHKGECAKPMTLGFEGAIKIR